MALTVGTRRALLAGHSRQGDGFVGLLDLFSGAVAAWSDLPLSAAMLGQPTLRLREDGGSTLDDFWHQGITDAYGNGTVRNAAGQTPVEWVAAEEGIDALTRQFYDQTGNGVHLIQETDAKQPTFAEVSGRQCAAFNGSSHSMGSSIDLALSTFSIFSVFSTGATAVIFYEHSPDANANDGGWFAHANPAINVTRTPGSASAGTAVFTNLSRAAYRHNYGTDADGRTRLYSDGSLLVQSGAVTINTDTVTQPFFVGARNNASIHSVMSLSTQIIFSPKKSASDEAAIDAWLMAAHGIS